jgi:hypothetical protein
VDILAIAEKPQYEVYANQQVFAVEGENWKIVAQATTPLSRAFLA